MKSIKYLVLSASILLAALSCREDEAFSGIVPLPEKTEKGTGMFTFSGNTVISVQDPGQEDAAGYLCGLFTTAGGFTPEVIHGCQEADVYFTEDSTLGEEAYRLEVTRKRIDIRASSPAGRERRRGIYRDGMGGTSRKDRRLAGVPVQGTHARCGPALHPERRRDEDYRLHGHAQTQHSPLASHR